jgi:hypothetical protein
MSQEQLSIQFSTSRKNDEQFPSDAYKQNVWQYAHILSNLTFHKYVILYYYDQCSKSDSN